MKLLKKILNKKVIAIAALALCCTGAAVGTTVAYLKDSTEEVVNTFEVGSIETELLEVISGGGKEPYVLNVGINPCYIRMRATVSPSDKGELKNLVVDLDETNWKYNADDGYYYYQNIVNPGEYTATPLFKAINSTQVSANDPFDIVLYQEAVQTTVSKADGTVVTDMMSIWEFYDNYNKSQESKN